ncbi:MAG: hypothetical protein M1409_03735 [Actinobacteria bacterium]|nr:hypothetical protein [Actinomycetota bacterium]
MLPSSFTRIRHFGFVSNRNRKENIAHLKKLFGVPGKTCERPDQSLEETMLELTGNDISKCPCCRIGILTLHHLIPRFSFWIDRNTCEPETVDTS